MGRYRLGVDSGGTFSDFVVVDEETNKLIITKVPSTPDDPSRAVLEGIKQLADDGIDPAEIGLFIHGTTVGTNALLEGKGARIGLLVTEGFRGIYETMEQAREYGSELHNLQFEKPTLLAPESRTFDIRERVNAQGAVDTPLDEASVERAIEGLEKAGVEAVAICYLFSFLHPEHERCTAELIRAKHPEWHVTSSAELLPQIREYYRLSTTVINAFISVKVSEYLKRLEQNLGKVGVTTPRAYVMQSNGGAATLKAAGNEAVMTLLSGPAGGVVAGCAIGKASGFPNVVTFDMGGTSCDVALAEGGMAQRTTRSTIDHRHIGVSSLSIHTVSAGGGTQAWVDELGMLHVGPESAGAVPGPVSYGRGGVIPAVTDCDLVLGYLNPDNFLGGRMSLDKEGAAKAIESKIAKPLKLGLYEAADGVVQVVNVKMAEAIRAISTQRGFDLRDFAMIAFGGAGPVHAGQLAIDLGIPTVIVPPYAGVNSAQGLMMCPVLHDYVVSRMERIDEVSPKVVKEMLSGLADRARRELDDEGFSGADIALDYFLDLRYAGQGYELTVPVARADLDATEIKDARSRFDVIHEQLHGHTAPDQPVEIVNYRVTGTGRVEMFDLPRYDKAKTPVEDARAGSREMYFSRLGSKPVACPIYDRAKLGPGHQLDGPAVVEQFDSTVVVQPEQVCRVDDLNNLILQRKDGGHGD